MLSNRPGLSASDSESARKSRLLDQTKSNGIYPLLFVCSDRIVTASWSRNKRAEEEEVLIAPSQQVVHGNVEVVGKVFEYFHRGKITFLFPTAEVLTGKVGVFS